MVGGTKASALGVILAMSVAAIPAVRAQQPVTIFDGSYETTSTADPQNQIQCGPGAGPLTIVVKDGKAPGPDRVPVDIGPNGTGQSNGRLSMDGAVTVPFKIVYHFTGNTVAIDLTVTRLSSGVCIYHRHGTKK
jgi:hypothetical protein